MNRYYIVFEKHYAKNSFSKSWVIRDTKNDMDTSNGLQKEIKELESDYECPVWLINWKKLEP